MSDRELAERLKRAVSRGDVNTARRLIKGGVKLHAKFWFEGTLLHEAVAQGKPEMVKIILQASCGVNAKDKAGQTALHLACRRGNMETVMGLLEHGAHINSITESGRSPLHIATWRKHGELASQLIKAGANINQQDDDGWTSLHWACRGNMHSLVQEMMQADAKVNIRDKLGRSPLHLCLGNEADPLLVKVLIKAGADCNMRTKTDSSLGVLLHNPSCSGAAIAILLQGGYLTHLDRSTYSSGLVEKALSDDAQTHNLLLSSLSTIPALTALCRQKIRSRLNYVHGGRALRRFVRRLPLPPLMLDFLMFSEELPDSS